ncbi:hypothetical protein EG348_07830 [Chryseobacterium sp. G0201]|nr:hypothetical protein EG348_07820 [Chryseobacterium sp. G0201]AZA52924.1 hypothetical protein EG348_07830 [Chryseobacterium sp. G0201]
MAVNNVESMKSDEMVNFDKAMKSLMNPENLSTPEEKAKNGNSTELNERSKEILYLASKKLISANGISEQELASRTSNSKEQAISLAQKIYFEKYNDIQKKIKSEN